MQRYEKVWKLLHLRLHAGGQGGKVHHEQCGGHHQCCRQLSGCPGHLLHHLQEALVPPAVYGQDTVGVPDPDVPAPGQRDRNRREDGA